MKTVTQSEVILKAGLYAETPEFPPDAVPRLHQSVAAEIVNRSPLHGWHKAFGHQEEEWNERTNLGNLAHALLLGGRNLHVVDADDWRTKDAREARDLALAGGLVPVLFPKLEEARKLVQHVQETLCARGWPLDCGQKEVTAIWRTPIGRVWCEGRLDYLEIRRRGKGKGARILDFKFTHSAAKKQCESRFIEYGYDIQHRAYVQAIETIYPTLAGRVEMQFVFIETEPPHAIRMMPLAGSMRASGEWRWAQACEIWKECLGTYGTGTPWRAYEDDGEAAECPPWALNAQIAEEIAQQQEAQAQ